MLKLCHMTKSFCTVERVFLPGLEHTGKILMSLIYRGKVMANAQVFQILYIGLFWLQEILADLL